MENKMPTIIQIEHMLRQNGIYQDKQGLYHYYKDFEHVKGLRDQRLSVDHIQRILHYERMHPEEPRFPLKPLYPQPEKVGGNYVVWVSGYFESEPCEYDGCTHTGITHGYYPHEEWLMRADFEDCIIIGRFFKSYEEAHEALLQRWRELGLIS